MKKPLIKKPRLTWKKSRKGVWEPYHRITWTEAGKVKQKVVKLNWQDDPERLDTEYWACEAGRHPKQQTPVKHTWFELVVEWRSDPRVQNRLGKSTKASYRREMDALLEKNAHKRVSSTTRPGLRKVHGDMFATPRKADWRLQIVSLLWEYGRKKLDWPLGENPASGIDKFGVQREFEPWPQWMLDKLPSAHQHVQNAAELILGTGQRPNAAISMQHDHFHGDTMRVVDEKGNEMFEVYCPERLASFVRNVPKKGKYIIAKNLTQPIGYNQVEKLFRQWRSDLGEEAQKYVLHGLRKLAIIQLAEAGCSDAEIQAVTNQSAETVAYYRKMANRIVLSRNAQRRRTEHDQNKNV